MKDQFEGKRKENRLGAAAYWRAKKTCVLCHPFSFLLGGVGGSPDGLEWGGGYLLFRSDGLNQEGRVRHTQGDTL